MPSRDIDIAGHRPFELVRPAASDGFVPLYAPPASHGFTPLVQPLMLENRSAEKPAEKLIIHAAATEEENLLLPSQVEIENIELKQKILTLNKELAENNFNLVQMKENFETVISIDLQRYVEIKTNEIQDKISDAVKRILSPFVSQKILEQSVNEMSGIINLSVETINDNKSQIKIAKKISDKITANNLLADSAVILDEIEEIIFEDGDKMLSTRLQHWAEILETSDAG